MLLQVAVLVAVCSCALSSPQLGGSYGIPSQFLQDTSFFRNRYLQDFPMRPVTHTLALTQPRLLRTPQPQPQPQPQVGGELELLPPLQHVVGTKYPAVNPGPGFRFPISQLLNPTPPPNLIH